MSESSVPGNVDCIRKNAEKEMIIIMDKTKQSTDFLKYMRENLTGKQSFNVH